MSQIRLTTTGTLDPVPLDDLGGVSFVHPTTDFVLYDSIVSISEFTSTEIRESSDLQAAIDNGYITIDDIDGNPITDITGDSMIIPLDLAKLSSPPAFEEGRIWYDIINKCPSFYNDKSESSNQLGREIWTRTYNDTIDTIVNAMAVYISGFDNTSGFPTIALANASNIGAATALIGLATHNIGASSEGEVLYSGTLHGYDTQTPGWSSGDELWLSDVVDGGLTTIRPSAPSSTIRVGIVGKIHLTDGTIEAHHEHHSLYKGTNEYFNGTILEDHVFTVINDAGTIYAQLEKTGGGDLSMIFGGEFITLICTPILQIELSAGSDSAPTLYFVYVLESAPTILSMNTTDFPNVQHVPIGTVYVPSAAEVLANGAYKVHAWTDHITDTAGQGHASHSNAWIRSQPATWKSGADCTPTGGVNNLDIAITAGIIKQLHDHIMAARDTALGDPIYIINHFTSAYTKVTNLAGQNDANGDSLSNSHFPIVILGVVNESEDDCRIMVNYPMGSYNSAANAIKDSNNYAVFTSPPELVGTVFLIAKLTISHTGGSDTYSIAENESLLGLFPSTSATGGVVGGSTTYSDNQFRIQSVGDPSKEMDYDVGGIDSATKRTLTIQNKDIIVAGLDDIKKYYFFTVLDETTNLVADSGTPIFTDYLPYDITVNEVIINAVIAPTDANVIVDIKRNGISIFDTLVSIDATEFTSLTAVTVAVLNATQKIFTKGDKIEVFVTQIGSTIAGTGLKVRLLS